MHARRAFSRAVENKVPSDVAATACLLISELVTNTVRHGDCQPDDILELLIEKEAGALRVAVCQEAEIGTLEVVGDQEAREGGWGLMLVQEMAQDWGVQSEPPCVWFRLAA